MSNEAAVRDTRTTDSWGRPVVDGVPRYGPAVTDDTTWPTGPMLVLGDEDVVSCAATFCRAFSSELYFTLWLLAVDPHGWTTKAIVELLDMPDRPPPAGVQRVIEKVAGELEELCPGCSVVVAIAAPGGGDRGPREQAWCQAVLQAAERCGLPVRGVVAVGAHRARLLHAGGQS